MVVTTHVVVRCAVAGAGLVLALSAPAQSQGLVPQAGEIVRAVKLSGPRFGVTTLSAGIVDSLSDDYDIDLSPVITQFGWQFEKRFYSQPSGFTAVTEWVLLVGGMEQGQFLPSVSWLVGVRTAGGVEFGAGPNVTAAGLGLAFAGGATFRAGSLNVPVNLAVVPPDRVCGSVCSPDSTCAAEAGCERALVSWLPVGREGSLEILECHHGAPTSARCPRQQARGTGPKTVQGSWRPAV